MWSTGPGLRAVGEAHASGQGRKSLPQVDRYSPASATTGSTRDAVVAGLYPNTAPVGSAHRNAPAMAVQEDTTAMPSAIRMAPIANPARMPAILYR